MGDSRFRAFISYSHADEVWGAWLQRALENYRAPKVLADKVVASGRSPRLAPVFRDREDLPVAGDLNTAIKTALAESEYQIVLCSPNAAASRWVNEEIKLFHKLHGPGRVFALIIGGEPGASRMARREAEECFPPALRFQLDADGEVTERPAEPLAADAREDGDGRRYAMLKVAAGMLGVGLDDLVRRDAQKRARRLWAITGSSLAATMLTGALAMVDLPDQEPTLAVATCFAQGETTIKNALTARWKECDRIAAVCRELMKMGAKVTEKEDGLVIHQDGSWRLPGTAMEGYYDHRMVMAFSVAGLAADGETKISDALMVEKSFGSYIGEMKQAGRTSR